MTVFSYGDRMFLLCGDVAECGVPCVAVTSGEEPTPAKLVEIIGNSKILYLLCDNEDAAFSAIFRGVPTALAAGGVVDDGGGRILVIERNGRLDLPKGRLEPGESLTDAAVREVTEETGADILSCGSLIGETMHFHNAYGHWELKVTSWFRMTAASDSALSPQAEEDIAEAMWMSPDDLRNGEAFQYATLRQLMRSYFGDRQS